MKNQAGPWGEPLFFENPDEAVRFGEVYREFMQDAWKPAGEPEWYRTGKKPHGNLPAQQGIDNPNLTEDQRLLRIYFRDCVYAWHDLPIDDAGIGDCDARHSKEWWYKNKIEHGALCSYFDLFMRSCLRHQFDQGSLPSDCYYLELEADLSHADINTYYEIRCFNAVGVLDLIDGQGTYDPTTGWLPPVDCGSGVLCFQDANGAKGWIAWSTYPGFIPLFFDADMTEETIDPGGNIMLHVLGGLGPFAFETDSVGFYFDEALTLKFISGDSQNVPLYCASGDCGFDFDPECVIHVFDACSANLFITIFSSDCVGCPVMSFDTVNTPSVINSGSYIQLLVKDGVGPFTFSTSDLGYYFDIEHTLKSITVDVRSAYLYCVSGSCGVDFDALCNLTVVDGCGKSVGFQVKNNSGSWINCQTWNFGTPPGCGTCVNIGVSSAEHVASGCRYRWYNATGLGCCTGSGSNYKALTCPSPCGISASPQLGWGGTCAYPCGNWTLQKFGCAP